MPRACPIVRFDDESLELAFVLVNYNGCELTIKAVDSILRNGSSQYATVVVVDNSSNDSDVETLRLSLGSLERVKLIENNENLGYFPALNVGLEYLATQPTKFFAVVVGNNDLEFPPDFYETVSSSRHLFAENPVVSPNIISVDGIHQNPLVKSRITRTRILIWEVFYSNYYLAMLMLFVAQRTRKFTLRNDNNFHDESGYISQGYGACYILTGLFFSEYRRLWDPVFLMLEEFFLSMQLEAKNYRIYYEPSIVVRHVDHASVSRLPSRALWSFTRSSYRLYRRFINPYRLNMRTSFSYTDWSKPKESQ